MAEGFRELVRADARRYRDYSQARFGYRPATFFLDPGFVCVFLHRIAHALHVAGLRKLSWAVMQLNAIVTGADIVPASRLGPGLLIPHPCGVTLSTGSGENLTVGSRAGCGGSVQSKDVGSGPGLPLLGSNVMLGEYSGCQGGIMIGDNAVIEGGAGALVDVPAGGRGILASSPRVSARSQGEAKVVSPEEADSDCPDCDHRIWGRSLGDWKADVDRLCGELERYEGEGHRLARRLFAALNTPTLALLIHRLSHWLHCNGHARLARVASAVNLLGFRVAIHPRACLGGGVLMPHLAALSFDGTAGRSLTIYANCVVLPALGAAQRPMLGDRVSLGGHAGIVESARVGDDVQLAPKVQLTHDAPAGAQAFSPMSRVKRLAPGEYQRRGDRDGTPVSRSALPGLRQLRSRDTERLRQLAPEAPFVANLSVALFRRASACHRSGYRRLARWLWRANMYLTGSDLAPDATVGPGLVIPYPAGVGLYGTAGADLTMHAQTMLAAEIDAPWPRQLSCAPFTGDRVTLDPHSGICGPATVGNCTHLHAGCILREDALDDALIEPRPLRIRMPIEAAPAKR